MTLAYKHIWAKRGSIENDASTHVVDETLNVPQGYSLLGTVVILAISTHCYKLISVERVVILDISTA